MSMKRAYLLITLCCFPLIGNAQTSSNEIWGEGMMITGKWSQLFYEANIGFSLDNGFGDDYIYMSMGYGKPTTKNAWRKFLPNSGQAAPGSKDEMMNMKDENTHGLHAGTIGIGWQHFFGDIIGFHVQAGWGFILNLSDNAPSIDTHSSIDNGNGLKTYIYNTLPIQAGFDIRLWDTFNLQVGSLYMWKEIPIICLGFGVAF